MKFTSSRKLFIYISIVLYAFFAVGLNNLVYCSELSANCHSQTKQIKCSCCESSNLSEHKHVIKMVNSEENCSSCINTPQQSDSTNQQAGFIKQNFPDFECINNSLIPLTQLIFKNYLGNSVTRYKDYLANTYNLEILRTVILLI